VEGLGGRAIGFRERMGDAAFETDPIFGRPAGTRDPVHLYSGTQSGLARGERIRFLLAPQRASRAEIKMGILESRP